MTIGKYGMILTFIWVFGVAAFVYILPANLIDLELNELGDFLSGITAPIAFLWLILGFYQQREELSLNTEALRLQQDELKNQVEETRALVAQSARHASATEELASLTKVEMEKAIEKDKLDAQPIFKPGSGHSSGDHVVKQFQNIGGNIWDLKIVLPPPLFGRISHNHMLMSGDTCKVDIEKIPNDGYEFDFEITYRDKFDEYRFWRFHYKHTNDFTAIN